MKKLITLLFSFLFATASIAQTDTSMAGQLKELQKMMKYEQSIPYQKGKVAYSDEIELNIPKGLKFIPKKEASYILSDVWGNPKRDDIGGMLVKDDFLSYSGVGWAFILSEEKEGYVKDDDANDINYDDLLKELQDAEPELNELRKKEGYGTIHTVGWASKPFYDSKNKVLHWAKELEFDGDKNHTLNYDVRVLGKSGLLSMNAVATMADLDSVKKYIPTIISIASFKDGYKYSDFNPATDNIAAYTVGGLVAGKVLAKVGFFALILKNIKLIGLAAVGLFSLLRKRIARLFGGSKEEGE